MIGNRNTSRYPIHLRDMNDYNVKMELNEFVGMKTPCDENITYNMNCNIEDMPLAMAYVPWQQWRMIYEPKEALKRGTIFKELDLPFEAAKECRL